MYLFFFNYILCFFLETYCRAAPVQLHKTQRRSVRKSRANTARDEANRTLFMHHMNFLLTNKSSNLMKSKSKL